MTKNLPLIIEQIVQSRFVIQINSLIENNRKTNNCKSLAQYESE